MRTKADQRCLAAEPFAAELTDIQLLPNRTHFCVSRVANVRVVCPHDGLGFWAMRVQQMSERLEHMGITQIPRLRTTIVHNAVIALGRCYQAGILSRVEEALAILLRVLQSLLKQIAALLDDRFLAFSITCTEDRAAIGRRLLLPRRETAI